MGGAAARPYRAGTGRPCALNISKQTMGPSRPHPNRFLNPPGPSGPPVLQRGIPDEAREPAYFFLPAADLAATAAVFLVAAAVLLVCF